MLLHKSINCDSQDKKQEARIADIKHIVKDVLKEQIAEHMRPQIQEQIRLELRQQIQAAVKEQISEHLPVSLQDQADESKRQLIEVRNSLLNRSRLVGQMPPYVQPTWTMHLRLSSKPTAKNPPWLHKPCDNSSHTIVCQLRLFLHTDDSDPRSEQVPKHVHWFGITAYANTMCANAT
ncbi:hypothetical protein AG1IA_09631 [Rhizoctonia solani AG-1 IA]|uniref:Uncharacterized protein n=1 Tax=Thanatephorus cucumeris (strain AG1-IA) TaxID=983506 RepID=L8WJ16_THACA|nr:hypothetical protein AG1IA_09631 [Rhizoctonia solani AG-1 IA]